MSEESRRRFEVSLSPFLLVFLGLLLSAAGGFLAGDFVSHISDVEIRLTWWMRLAAVAVLFSFAYVFVYLLPVESLPVSRSPNPPRSRLHFLQQIAAVRYMSLLCLFVLPEAVISAAVGDVPPVQALIRFGLGFPIFAVPGTIWMVMSDLSPSFHKVQYRHLIISGAAGFLVAFVASVSVALSGSAELTDDLVYCLALDLVAVPYFIEAGYRSARKDWVKKEVTAGGS
ncbi:hypothetical protein Adeg_2168 (plasmid) [Ammonifex degensii KC4]|uniref:Uncharacterized protein n=1 Tax=Ammonifex degensii (strain DSM 10501 / KC4) TaxID=429009 RepID=C9RDH4_AMMDK|nr:hypothetical protein [Ammonifex degensii]ACX53245.1 hypothetical protein Adeg_2168 [Ammonifex degensii KC4]